MHYAVSISVWMNGNGWGVIFIYILNPDLSLSGCPKNLDLSWWNIASYSHNAYLRVYSVWKYKFWRGFSIVARFKILRKKNISNVTSQYVGALM